MKAVIINRFTACALALSALLLVLTGCTTTEIDEFRQSETGIGTNESIVILGRREKNAYETEADFVSCVADVVSNGRDGIRVIPERTFLDAMFPYFEPRTAPMRTNHLEQILQEEHARRTLEDFGVEYIVWLDGMSQRLSSAGSLSCAAGPGGAGCFGFSTWENGSNYEAEVWHLSSLSTVGTISTDSNGQSYMPAIVIPIPLIARVEANACNGMGNQLRQFIHGTG